MKLLSLLYIYLYTSSNLHSHLLLQLFLHLVAIINSFHLLSVILGTLQEYLIHTTILLGRCYSHFTGEKNLDSETFID